MNSIKACTDHQALLGSPISNEDITDQVLEGLDDSYQGVKDGVNARDSPISFAELHEKLITRELAIKNQPILGFAPATAHPTYSKPAPQYSPRPSFPARNKYQQTQPTHNTNYTGSRPFLGKCQWCHSKGHSLQKCPVFKEKYPTINPPYPTVRTPQANVAIASSTSIQPDWLLDSGASHHVTKDLDNLSLHNPYDGTEEIVIGDGSGLPISHIGSSLISASSKSLKLSNVLCVPSMHRNIISISKLCRDNNLLIIFASDSYVVKDRLTWATLLTGPVKDGIYEISSSLASIVAYSSVRASTIDWHHRLGHPSLSTFKSLVSVLNLKQSCDFSFNCNACQCNKSHKLPFNKNTLTSTSPLELLYTDVWTSPIYSLDGYKYYVLFVDHYTKYIWLYPLKRKSDTTATFIRFKALVEKYFGTSIKTIYTDNGGEYQALTQFLTIDGISHLTTPPHTPEHNGYAERRHRHIVETALSLLSHANLPLELWSNAVTTAAYLINRLPTATLRHKHHNVIPHYPLQPSLLPPLWSNAVTTAAYLINRLPTATLRHKAPYECLFGTSPNYLKLRSFGCLCYPWLRPYSKHKLDTRSTPCIFVGYSATQSAYYCLDPKTHKIYTSRHVRFVESSFPYSELSSTKPLTQYPTLDSWCPLIIPILPIEPTAAPQRDTPLPTPAISSTSTSSPSSPAHSSSPPPCSSNAPSSRSLSSPQSSAQPLTTMVTRSRNNIFKPNPKYAHLTTLSSHPIEPISVAHALAHPLWRQAMQEEITALHKLGTWTLVPPASGQNIVKCKWVFRVKYKPDGSVDRYRARLVAKGFQQRPGIDYTETFSPVVKPATIRTLLSLAMTHNWSLRQLDINNAFLNGTLHEQVYMAQPPGFCDDAFPGYVCELRKAIYGLKQAPRAWYIELTNFLLSCGFRRSIADASLFINNRHFAPMYLIVYVDDIVLTSPDTRALEEFIECLAQKFALKDLGTLSYFLGVEVIPSVHGLFLSQRKYIVDLLDRAKMSGAKPVSTPMAVDTTLSLHSGDLINNPTEYRTLVGSLQYLTLTRPDVAFVVNKLSQFMHAPRSAHWTVLKRLLRYLIGSLDKGITIQRDSPFHLHAFSDADWGGDKDDYKSTMGHVVFLGRNPICWSSKKQQFLAQSSTEAEYKALAATTGEILWLRNLLQEMGVRLLQVPVIYCDNLGATYLSANPVFHSRMKHLAIAYHFVREQVQLKSIRVTHIPTGDQLADPLTKPLARGKFALFMSKIGLSTRPSALRGHVKDKYKSLT